LHPKTLKEEENRERSRNQGGEEVAGMGGCQETQGPGPAPEHHCKALFSCPSRATGRNHM